MSKDASLWSYHAMINHANTTIVGCKISCNLEKASTTWIIATEPNHHICLSLINLTNLHTLLKLVMVNLPNSFFFWQKVNIFY